MKVRMYNVGFGDCFCLRDRKKRCSFRPRIRRYTGQPFFRWQLYCRSCSQLIFQLVFLRQCGSGMTSCCHILFWILINIMFAFEWRMALAALWVIPVSAAIVVGSYRVQDKVQARTMAAKMACADGIQDIKKRIK